MLQDGKDQAAAIKFFQANVKEGFGTGNNRMALIRKWGKRFTEEGTVHDANSRRTGRPRRLPVPLVLTLVGKFLEGYKVSRKQYFFYDIKHAVKVSKMFAMVTQFPGVTPAHLWRLMLQAVPSLRLMKHAVDFKSKLDDRVRKLRVEAVEKLCQWTLQALQRVVWIDAKKIYITAEGVRVYCAKSDMVVEDPSLLLGKRDAGLVLHYYAAVNALVGVVYFTWVTGTTGLESVRNYAWQTKVWLGIC